MSYIDDLFAEADDRCFIDATRIFALVDPLFGHAPLARIGELLGRMTAHRADLGTGVRAVIAACEVGDHEAARTALATIGFRATRVAIVIPERKLAYVSRDVREAELVDVLRVTPRDAPTRAVYADWLEETGDHARAAYVRAPASITPAGDPAWRSIVSRAAFTCGTSACPPSWDRLAPTHHDDLRRCETCNKFVYYVRVECDAAVHGMRYQTIAIDESLDAEFTQHIYRQGMPPRLMTRNPPRPQPSKKAR